MIRHAGITVDVHGRTISYGGRRSRLQPQQALIARALLANAGSVVSLDQIFDILWGDPEDGGPLWSSHIIQLRVYAVRRVLRAIGVPCRIQSRHGRGYWLEISVAEARRHAA